MATPAIVVVVISCLDRVEAPIDLRLRRVEVDNESQVSPRKRNTHSCCCSSSSLSVMSFCETPTGAERHEASLVAVALVLVYMLRPPTAGEEEQLRS